MNFAGMRPVLVHGGGPDINKKLDSIDKKCDFVHGHRITDKETLEVVDSVLEKINRELTGNIKELGGNAFGIVGREVGLIKAKKRKIRGVDVDLGFVGDVVSVDTTVVERLVEANVIPVVAPIAKGKDGNIYNVNADSSASAMAVSLFAEKFVLLTDTMGIMEDRNNPDSLIHTVSVSEVKKLIKKGVIEEGMIPKANACVEAINKGVKKAHIINANLPHALLLEIFTDKGIGTQIVRD
jgi:acetylglutamate kinase